MVSPLGPLWHSIGFPMDPLVFPNGILKGFVSMFSAVVFVSVALWISYGFPVEYPMDSPCPPMGFLWGPCSFPMKMLWIPIVYLWDTYGFPMGPPKDFL